MATKHKARRRSAARSHSPASFRAGDRVQEGTIIEIHNGAALIGREPADASDRPVTGETELFVQGRPVFLATGQAFIPLTSLHRLAGSGKGPKPKGPTPAEYRFQIFQDAGGTWRWRILAHNGRTVADSGEGYASKSNASRAVSDLNNTDWPIPVEAA
jgi:uncharacterized protein YegP (UPF0339 family)